MAEKQTQRTVILFLNGESIVAAGDPDAERLNAKRQALGILQAEGWTVEKTHAPSRQQGALAIIVLKPPPSILDGMVT